MFKKIISLICVFAMLLSVCACSGGKDASSNDLSSKEDTSSKADDNTEDTQSKTEEDTSSTTSKPDRTLWTRKMVCLTFDDGPQESNPELLDILKEKGVKATFFLMGQNMEKYPDTVRRMIAEGHDVGSHSYSHGVARDSSENFVRKDFEKVTGIMKEIAPDYKMTLYRNPGGQTSDNIFKVAKEYDWRVINWSNYEFDDSTEQNLTPEERCSKMYQQYGAPRNGEIYLIHPRDSSVNQGVALLIDRLLDQGFELVTVSELLKRRNGGEAGTMYNYVY